MPRVTPLYYHYSNEPSICDAFDNAHVQYNNDTLHIIRSVFKTPIQTLYQICKICGSFAVQYITPKIKLIKESPHKKTGGTAVDMPSCNLSINSSVINRVVGMLKSHRTD